MVGVVIRVMALGRSLYGCFVMWVWMCGASSRCLLGEWEQALFGEVSLECVHVMMMMMIMGSFVSQCS